MFWCYVTIIPMLYCCRFFYTVCFDGPCALSSEDYFPCLWRFYLSIQHHSSCLRFPISRVCKSVHLPVSICVSIKLSSEPSGKLTQQCDDCLLLRVELTHFKTCNFIFAFVIFTFHSPPMFPTQSTSRVCFPNGIDFVSWFDYWYMLIYNICYQYKDKIDFTRNMLSCNTLLCLQGIYSEELYWFELAEGILCILSLGKSDMYHVLRFTRIYVNWDRTWESVSMFYNWESQLILTAIMDLSLHHWVCV